jgi:riboflavin kinase/FMN adenylyltransferase
MRVHRAYWSLPKAALFGVVAIGNFDGVHRGHRALIAAARAAAAALGAPLGVVTFEPHPMRVVRPDQAPPLLTSLRTKARLLARLGVERLFALTFNDHLRRKPSDAFVHDVLAGGLGVRHVVVGYDFRFGHQAAGDVDRLRVLGEEYGFGVGVVEPVSWRGAVCSSSRIRAAIAAGEIALANDLLGHPFAIEGRVAQGDRRGRTLGYPTANLRPVEGLLWPAPGIYAVRAEWTEGGVLHQADGAASLGYRPTFGGRDLLLEVHLLDRSADLYGRRLCCSFIERLRDEARFESIEALKAQMAEDCAQARAILAKTLPSAHIGS